MKEKINSQKGFIKTPISVAIIAGILITGGGYFAYKQYQAAKDKQAKEEHLTNEREKQAQETLKTQQDQLKSQQEALEKTKQELEVLKQKQAEQEKKPPQIITKEVPTKIDQITAAELNTYLTTVLYISCGDTNYEKYRNGSGFFWNFGRDNYSVITNKHVMSLMGTSGSCWGTINDIKGNGLGLLKLTPQASSALNSNADIISTSIWTIPSERTAPEFNYKLTALKNAQII